MLNLIKQIIPSAKKLISETDNPQLIKTIAAMYAVGAALFDVALAIENDGFQVRDLAAAFSVEAIGAFAFIGYLIYTNKNRKNK